MKLFLARIVVMFIRFKYFITALIVVLMLYSFFSGKELFPFAPFNMYSRLHTLQEYQELKIDFLNGNNQWIQVQNEMIKPIDEATLKNIFFNSYLKHNDSFYSNEVEV